MRVLTFDTTHHALFAEQLAHTHGFAAEVVPAPAGAQAKCDLAIEFLPEEEDGLVDVLRRERVAFRIYEA